MSNKKQYILFASIWILVIVTICYTPLLFTEPYYKADADYKICIYTVRNEHVCLTKFVSKALETKNTAIADNDPQQ